MAKIYTFLQLHQNYKNFVDRFDFCYVYCFSAILWVTEGQLVYNSSKNSYFGEAKIPLCRLCDKVHDKSFSGSDVE